MDRAGIASHIGFWFKTYLSEAGITATDDVNNLGPIISETFRAMGKSDYTDPFVETETTLAAATLAQAEYRFMLFVVNTLGSEFDVSTGGDAFRLEQVWQHAQKKLEETKALVEKYFGPSLEYTDESGSPFIMLDLNFLEESY